MRIVVAEKRSVADAICACLPKPLVSARGYIVAADNTCVTWLRGHILTLYEPHDYDPALKRWSVAALPIVPPSWSYKPLEGDASANQQLKTVLDLIAKATEIVNAGDPDREGNLLVMEVIEYAKYRGPITRFIAGAQDAATVRLALRNIEPYERFRAQLDAAKARSWGDWLVGMNCSRAATKLLANNALVSVGRVQTPVLALVVTRDRAIETFRVRGFFEVVAVVDINGVQIELSFNPQDEAQRIWHADEARSLAKQLHGTQHRLVVTTEPGREGPPKLYTLTTFQQWANKTHKWTSAKTLEILQALYERKATTYPRTDIEVLPDNHVPFIPATLAALSTLVHVPVGLAEKPTIRKTVFNTKRVAEHHAVVPTTDSAPLSRLDELQRLAYSEIALRYVLALMPDCTFIATRAAFEFAGRSFVANGRTITALGWRAHPATTPPEAKVLPQIPDGAIARVLRARVVEHQTTPPEPYTEASLLADMSAAHKFITNPIQAAVLKNAKGLGTPATRAAIIEELKARRYIIAHRGKIRATPFGREVIDVLPEPLRDPALTAVWETRFAEIEAGNLARDSFIADLVRFVERNLAQMKSSTRRISATPDPVAPAHAAKTKAGGKAKNTTAAPRARHTRKEANPHVPQ